MTRNSVYSCPSCNTTHTLALDDTSVLACKNCYEIVAVDDNIEKPVKSPIPDDWSFVQIGSTAEFKKTPLKIVGRIRLQLRNEYKNFWCADAGLGKCLWIVESFGSFAVFEPTWAKYTENANKLRSGSAIVLTEQIRLIGEYVEKVEEIAYEGELGPWTMFTRGAFLVQASDTQGRTAIYFIDSKHENIQYLAGEKITPANLKLTNILMWNEWK